MCGDSGQEVEDIRIVDSTDDVARHEGHVVEVQEVKLLPYLVVVEAESECIAVVSVYSEIEEIAIETGIIVQTLAATNLCAAEDTQLKGVSCLFHAINLDDGGDGHGVGIGVCVHIPVIVTLFHEVCHEVAVVIEGESKFGLGRDHITVLRPADKGVTCVGRGRHGHCRALQVLAAANYVTTLGGVGRHGDRVVHRCIGEVGHQGAVARHHEGESGFKRNDFVANGPVAESIAFIGRGHQGAEGAVVVAASAFNRTAFHGIGYCGDGVCGNGVQEVEDIGGVGRTDG